MFAFSRKSFINHEMSKYIKQQTNNSIEKYLRKPKNKLITIKEFNSKNSYYDVNYSDLDIAKEYPPIFFLLLPFVVCPFFLAGYYFNKV